MEYVRQTRLGIDFIRLISPQAAQTTGAWIITGGTNTGVMKHVGEAVRGQTVTSHPVMDDDTQLHLIGVATWGIIDHKESLVNNKVRMRKKHLGEGEDFTQLSKIN